MLKKQPELANKIRGKVISKSIELYLTKKPIEITYDKLGNMHKKYFDIFDFAEEMGVGMDAIWKWKRTGNMNKLCKIKLIRMGVLPKELWYK
jgi:hypothetical protein